MIPDWMNHVELVVLASLIVLIVSSFVNSIVSCGVQRWILKSDCSTCIPAAAIPEIVKAQTKLRQETLPKIEVLLATIVTRLDTIEELLREKRAARRQENGE
jgi:hypothetical protein